MLLSSIFVSSASWFGFEFMNIFLKRHLDLISRIGVGCPFGVIVAGWIIYITNVYFPFSLEHGMLVATILALIALGIRTFIHHIPSPKGLSTDNTINMVFIPFFVLVIYLFVSNLLNGNITRGAVYGDLPFHLNLINSFVYGCNSRRKSLYDTLSPFFAGEKLAYPIIPDFISAAVHGCFNSSLQMSLVIPSIPFAFGIYACLNKIIFSFSKMKFACLVGPWLFFFSGGLGFDMLCHEHPFRIPNIDFIHYWGKGRNEYWLQTLIHILLPQRCSLFSIPICWAYIMLLNSINFERKLNPKVFFACGLLVAALGQVQAHSLIALFEFTACYAVLHFPWKNYSKWKENIFCYLLIAVPGLILNIPQLYPYINRAESGHLITLRPIWLDDRKNFFTLWWYGLGVFFAISIFIAPVCLDKRRFILYLPSLFVFAVSNFIKYQPWNLDNTKVFNAAWIPLAVAAVGHFLSYLKKNGGSFGYLLTIIFTIACCLSGFLAVAISTVNEYPLWYQQENPHILAGWVKQNTSPQSIWATDSYHDMPISTLAGRQILVGYRGWMGSHMLNEWPRIRAMEKLDHNPEDTEEIDKLNVDYALVFKGRSRELKLSPGDDSNKWLRVFESQSYIVYQRINK